MQWQRVHYAFGSHLSSKVPPQLGDMSRLPTPPPAACSSTSTANRTCRTARTLQANNAVDTNECSHHSQESSPRSGTSSTEREGTADQPLSGTQSYDSVASVGEILLQATSSLSLTSIQSTITRSVARNSHSSTSVNISLPSLAIQQNVVSSSGLLYFACCNMCSRVC